MIVVRLCLCECVSACINISPVLQVMLWQRKIELEREMNDVLDPSVGGDVVGAMKKEIHRMQLRAAELSRIQETLLLDLERSIAKRDIIALKVCITTLRCRSSQ